MNSYEYCRLHEPKRIHHMSSYESCLLHGVEGDFAFLSYVADERVVSCHKLRIQYRNNLPYIKLNVPFHRIMYLDDMLELDKELS